MHIGLSPFVCFLPDIQRERGFQRELLHDWRFTANQFVFATSPLRLTTSIFFQLNTCGHSPYVKSCRTREWVCRLQLLLALASAVILRSESRVTNDHILLSQIRDSLNLEGQVSILISPRNRVAQLYPQPLGSLFVSSYDSQGYVYNVTYIHIARQRLGKQTYNKYELTIE
jgi:hypothetical protein